MTEFTIRLALNCLSNFQSTCQSGIADVASKSLEAVSIYDRRYVTIGSHVFHETFLVGACVGAACALGTIGWEDG